MPTTKMVGIVSGSGRRKERRGKRRSILRPKGEDNQSRVLLEAGHRMHFDKKRRGVL